MCHERREEDGSHAFRHHVFEQNIEQRDGQREAAQLAELDADVESEERRQQMRSGELQRLAKGEREAEAVNEAEPERDEPAALELGSDDVLERHVDDRDRDEHLDERRKPQRARREAQRGREQGDGVRDGERRYDRDERTDPPEGDHEANDEQQVVDAVHDVPESQLHEPPERLAPARVEVHQPRIADVLERPFGAAGRKEPQDGVGAHAEPRERGVDGEA